MALNPTGSGLRPNSARRPRWRSLELARTNSDRLSGSHRGLGRVGPGSAPLIRPRWWSHRTWRKTTREKADTEVTQASAVLTAAGKEECSWHALNILAQAAPPVADTVFTFLYF